MGHFGRGLAGNSNNFGGAGQKPPHPELLDWLATELIVRGWSIKALHRLLMSSETYRRASRHPDPQSLAERDSHCSSYAVFAPRRLEAEELRDAILRVTGEIHLAVGGIPIRPELNPEGNDLTTGSSRPRISAGVRTGTERGRVNCGHMTFECTVRDQPGIGNTLEFLLATDQTFTRFTVAELAAVVKRFPVIGSPFA